jgi:CRISPR type I-D-associated protein Csc1
MAKLLNDNLKLSHPKIIYKCRLVAHDYLFFSTIGFRDTLMTNYIGNYALMYAINRRTSETQRNASGTTPFYERDMPKMKIYSTPASITTESKVPITKYDLIIWENQPQTYVTFNSVNTITQLTETSRVNLPQIGRKAKFLPLNSFEFFAIGGDPSGVLRLGKKQVACRIFAEPLNVKEISSNTFHPSHPINLEDAKGLLTTNIKSAELIKQTPPLIVNAYLKAEHYVCSDRMNTYNILKPDASKYQNVAFP